MQMWCAKPSGTARTRRIVCESLDDRVIACAALVPQLSMIGGNCLGVYVDRVSRGLCDFTRLRIVDVTITDMPGLTLAAPQVRRWADCPTLERLTLRSRTGDEHPNVCVELGDLPLLQHFAVAGAFTFFARTGWPPPNLSELVLSPRNKGRMIGLDTLLQASASIRSIRGAALHAHEYWDAEWVALARCTSLSHLSLRLIDTDSHWPSRLSALTALTELQVPAINTPSAADAAALARLTRLRLLILSDCCSSRDDEAYVIPAVPDSWVACLQPLLPTMPLLDRVLARAWGAVHDIADGDTDHIILSRDEIMRARIPSPPHAPA
jgi:hypothetical protein